MNNLSYCNFAKTVFSYWMYIKKKMSKSSSTQYAEIWSGIFGCQPLVICYY